LYEDVGPRLFSNPQPAGRLKLTLWALRNLNSAANSSEVLRANLKDAFGDETIGEVYTRREIAICLPASRLLDWSPKVFKTPQLEHFTRDKDVRLVDACLATSAAPIFFPVASIREGSHSDLCGNFVDGGLWANNPSLVGLLEGLDLCTDRVSGKI